MVLLSLREMIAVLTVTVAVPAFASESSVCFDFKTKIVSALHEAAPKPGQDSKESGKRADGTSWAAVRGEVRLPMARLLQLLRDHSTAKDPQVSEQRVERVQSALYLADDRVMNVVKPFPFVKITWTEEWAYAVAEGAEQDPRTVVISYQKTEGTSYMAHFCGNIVLRSLGADLTEVSQYEEGRISGQEAKDRLEGLTGLLTSLRKR